MATADQQGIMALPQDAAAQPPAQPQMGLDESYDAVKQGLTNASPAASQQLSQMMAKITPELDQLDDNQINSLLQLIQYLHDHPDEYAERVKELVDQGIIDEGDFPPDYNPEFLAAVGTVLLHALNDRQGGAQAAPEMTPPATMARGGIADAARQVANSGRGQDTMLAHITPREAALLRSHGGVGTINPKTGLPEYGLWSSIVSTVKGAVSGIGSAISGAVKGLGNTVKSVFQTVTSAVKSVLQSPIGKVLGTVALATFLGPGALGVSGLNLGLSTAATLGLASGATTLLAGGSLKQALISGATAYFGAPGGAVSNLVGQAGITNMAANAAASAGIVGAGAALLSGQKLGDAVKSGLTAGAIGGLATGATQGFGTSIPKVEAPTVPTDLSAAGNAPTSVGTQATPAPASADPMGEFIQKNEQLRNAANTPAQMPPPPSGIASVWDKARGFYNENISPSGIKEAAIPQAEAAGQAAYDRLAGSPEAIRTAAYQRAYDAAMPGMISTYGPAVAAGLGVTALAGGFNQTPPQPTQVQSDINQRLAAEKARVAANPGAYVPKGMERFGIQYDDKGQITGSQPWNPQLAGPTEVAATPYVQYTPSPYMTPTGAIGSGKPVAQPYNTSNMYNFMPRYAADGGIMSTVAPPPSPVMRDMGGIATLASGGYPRRTGQIAGPGTETSDSIPAMLSDGEFVMTAKAVRGAGKGSRLAGAKKMYALMHQLEKNAARG